MPSTQRCVSECDKCRILTGTTAHARKLESITTRLLNNSRGQTSRAAFLEARNCTRTSEYVTLHIKRASPHELRKTTTRNCSILSGAIACQWFLEQSKLFCKKVAVMHQSNNSLLGRYEAVALLWIKVSEKKMRLLSLWSGALHLRIYPERINSTPFVFRFSACSVCFLHKTG